AAAGYEKDEDLSVGSRARSGKINLSHVCELAGHLHHDMFQQKKLLLNHVPVTIRMQKASDKFSLHVKNSITVQPKIKILSASLMVKKVKLMHNPQLAMMSALDISP